MIGFVLASLACALAPSNEALIGARAVQGAAAALVIPQTFGLIRAMFSGAELPRALGTIGPVMALSAILGPVLGGVLIHADLLGSSWRAVFLVNVPLGVGVLACTGLLREERSFSGSRRAAMRALLAALDTDEGRLETAVRLAGAAARQEERMGVRVWPVVDRERDVWLEHARGALREDQFARTWKIGQAMTREQALEFALDDSNRHRGGVTNLG